MSFLQDEKNWFEKKPHPTKSILTKICQLRYFDETV